MVVSISAQLRLVVQVARIVSYPIPPAPTSYRDTLQNEQRLMLSALRGPDGRGLRSCDWRVRLTNEDEVVVVAVTQ